MDLDLLRTLVSIDTSEGKNRDKIIDILRNAAKERELNFSVVKDSKGIANIIIEGKGEGKRVLFITHYDVVPPGDGWTRDPFTPSLEDGKLYGRGAADDKSAIVAVLDAMKDVEGAIKPVLVIAGAEETGESEEFMRSLEGDLAIVVDASPTPTIGASGVVKWTVKIKGKQAHSGYPFLGDNAVYKATEIVNFVKWFGEFAERVMVDKYPAVEYYERIPVRASATVIRGGHAWNVIPEEVIVEVSVRTVPMWNHAGDVFIEMLKDFAERRNIELVIREDIRMPAWVSEGPHVNRFISIYEEVTGEKITPAIELGGTDGAHFADRMPVIQFGPMRPENRIHGPDEFVYLKDVEMVENVVRKIIEKGI